MKILRVVVIAFLLVAALAGTMPVKAQTVASIVDTTLPISQDLRDTLNSWLSVSPPDLSLYWVVTYTQEVSTDTYVSLAALDDWDPEAASWSLDDGTAVWIGSVIVHEGGSVELYYPDENGPSALEPDGGSSLVKFPWTRGDSMMYSTRGVHSGYGLSNMAAVNWIGGDDLGSGIAANAVYSAITGTVDFVCYDSQSVAVRLQGGSDYYLYGHLDDNENLRIGHTFNTRTNIASMVTGSFNGPCGWASQTDNHYNLLWMFTPDAKGIFQVESCFLNTADQTWDCGERANYSPGEYVADDGTGSGGDGGGGGGGGDDPGTSNEDVTFYDYILVGFIQLWQTLVIDKLPPHETFEYTAILLSTVKLTLRIARVLVYGNINLGHLMTVIVVGLAIKAVFGLAWLVAFIFKAWKSLVPIIGA